jgi:hypothetical protein
MSDILTPQGRFEAGAGPARWRQRLAETLDLIAGSSADFRDEWWIIGSAAAALSGADILDVRDVDLLVSVRDAECLGRKWSSTARSSASPDEKFRSAIFMRFETGKLAVEAFGGFEMNVRGVWRPVSPLTRVWRGGVFTPSVAEQIAILEAMGRKKDLARIVALCAQL